MRRAQALTLLLLSWVLLAAFEQHSNTTTKVQATRSVDLKLRPTEPCARLATRHILTTSVEEEKMHKRPSGPNPGNNRRPPSRP